MNFFAACSGLTSPDYWEALSNNEPMSYVFFNDESSIIIGTATWSRYRYLRYMAWQLLPTNAKLRRNRLSSSSDEASHISAIF